MHFVTNLFPVMGVQNLSKSVKICQSWCKKFTAMFLCHTVYMLAAPAANNDVPYISSLVKNSVNEKLSSGCSAEEQPPPPVFHVFPCPREKLPDCEKHFSV